ELSGDVPEIELALLAALNLMNDHLIGTLHLLKMIPAMTLLPARFLVALWSQAFRWTNKAIGGGRQATIVTVFGKLALQCFDTLLQIVNRHQRLPQPFAQGLILLSKSFQFFIVAHTCSLANLGSRSQLWDPLLNS